MALSAKMYASANAKAFAGGHKWKASGGDTYKMALLTASDIANVGTHNVYSDLANEVANGSGYTTGGVAITLSDPTTTVANSFSTSRAASTAYNQGDIIKPATGNGFLYVCVVAGTTGASLPTYTTTVWQTLTDGGVTWMNIGESIVQLTGGNAVWSASTITAACGVLYDSATANLLSCVDFGGSPSSTSSTFQVTMPALGWGWLAAA